MSGKRRRVIRIVATLAPLLLVPLVGTPAAAQAKHSKESIVKAWKDRDDRTRSAHFSWTEKQTDTRGVISTFWKLFNPALKEIIPPNDTTYTNMRSLAFERDKLRHENSSFAWSTKTNRYEPMSYLSVFDGETCKVLDKYDKNAAKPWPQAVIREEKQHVDATVAVLQPILMTYRSMTAGMCAWNLEDFILSRQTAVINKKVCLELNRRLAFVKLETKLWVDPARDFVIVRILTLDDNVVTNKIDVEYDQNAEMVWVPKEWEVTFNNPKGNLERTYKSRVTEYSINPTGASPHFDIDFPLGTAVTNAKDNSRYIIRPDGSGKRMIPPSDIGATYEQALATDPGKAFPSQDSNAQSISWPTIGLIVTAVAVLYFFLKFAWNRKKGDNHESAKS
ncbi:MAG: hypothetical protein L0Y70_12415 [Gemmataceae bacterium]|nr:hypothetical protein [Gemmataceae bacterium]